VEHALAARSWVPERAERRVAAVADGIAGLTPTAVADEIERLVGENRRIHDDESLNLNPASNVMNPRAEALLSAGLGSRASLGYPGAKYEMGLEAIEQLEVIAAELAAEVFGAAFAEVRVGSGALANLYAFMATCRPGDTIIAPPAEIGGHVTHHRDGAAGRYGLRTVPAPVAADGYTIDVDRLRDLARQERPALITVGGSLNLFPHPVKDIAAIADEVGARVLFDAAHLCGPIAGGAWPNPLREGAHLVSMSTYKSLGGPAGGLLVTDDPDIAEALDAIAYPGLTANFDAGRTAALAMTLLDWKAAGPAYARTMVAVAGALAAQLSTLGVAVFAAERGATRSHAFAVSTPQGGQRTAQRLRRANLLTSGIGLPITPVAGELNGLRIGTPEIVRRGVTVADTPQLAALLARGLDEQAEPETVAREVTAWRRRFTGVAFTA
jgi:glycine hydroxymethyltransferase